jgi:hypothetical protein
MLALAASKTNKPIQKVQRLLRPLAEWANGSSSEGLRIHRANPTNQARPAAARHHQAE